MYPRLEVCEVLAPNPQERLLPLRLLSSLSLRRQRMVACTIGIVRTRGEKPRTPRAHRECRHSFTAMSQGYAIELYFDPALENQVLKAWNVLARRQISTQLIEMESRPHITLLSSPHLDPPKLQSVIKSFASKQEPLPLTLSSIAAFSSSEDNSFFLAPTPSAALLQLHSQLCDTLRREGVDIGDDYRPDMWVPHCAVAQEVPRSRLPETFFILRDLKLPVSGYAMDVGLVEFSPVRELFSFPLGNSLEA
ncbi:hypothetical protein ACLOJK_030988 [Asimina triloba]